MTTREKVLAIIDRMSEQELEAEYERLRPKRLSDLSGAEWDEMTRGLDEIRAHVRVPLDAVKLVRASRDELAQRGL